MKKALNTGLIALGLSLMASASSVQAADCGSMTNQNAMNQCFSNEYKNSDAELNKLYKEIGNRLKDDADTLKALRNAQRAWISFRDAECDFAAINTQGGSIHSMLITTCRNELTQARIKNFNTYLSCEEGDMSCPVPPAM
ncbi:lysozyme inhibitor LprI family protein [Alcaligenes faecalis subsp. faecalis]|uniref:lysozyme inhibitor LprI family protein n=1 Tax=Alcaligenes faecalis TaxID=511 RepID=UPI001F42CB4C|nr:lysozyme inhibitor LprI family protein [Alcaligenes faecalis]MBW4789527.1 lysozyme inhibitor LprI family protein [Alcaligenes faecalis subsp. faecalis]